MSNLIIIFSISTLTPLYYNNFTNTIFLIHYYFYQQSIICEFIFKNLQIYRSMHYLYLSIYLISSPYNIYYLSKSGVINYMLVFNIEKIIRLNHVIESNIELASRVHAFMVNHQKQPMVLKSKEKDKNKERIRKPVADLGGLK